MSHWITTSHGQDYFLSGIDIGRNVLDIRTIAHALSCINRFTGHAQRPYSVAEHSLLCVDIAQQLGLSVPVQLACLLHDAHEAFINDVSSPVKDEIHRGGSGWIALEHRHAFAVRSWAGLQSTFTGNRDALRRVDLIALATERRDLINFEPGRNLPWSLIDTASAGIAPADFLYLNTRKRELTSWSEWRDKFLDCHDALRTKLREATLANLQEAAQ